MTEETKPKSGPVFNAGAKFNQDTPKSQRIHNKAMRRQIRGYSLQTIKRKRGSHASREYGASLIDRLQAVWDLKAEARANSTNSHEARRVFEAELADRRARRHGEPVKERERVIGENPSSDFDPTR